MMDEALYSRMLHFASLFFFFFLNNMRFAMPFSLSLTSKLALVNIYVLSLE